MVVTLAKSKAGHDRNHIYVILSEEADGVYLVNGTTKTLEHPKRKKKIHIQPIKNLPSDITALCDGEAIINDELVRKILKMYEMHLLAGSQSQFSK